MIRNPVWTIFAPFLAHICISIFQSSKPVYVRCFQESDVVVNLHKQKMIFGSEVFQIEAEMKSFGIFPSPGVNLDKITIAKISFISKILQTMCTYIPGYQVKVTAMVKRAAVVPRIAPDLHLLRDNGLKYRQQVLYTSVGRLKPLHLYQTLLIQHETGQLSCRLSKRCGYFARASPKPAKLSEISGISRQGNAFRKEY